MWLIFHGYRFCRDDDEVIGYVSTQVEAKAIEAQLNEIGSLRDGCHYMIEEVEPLHADFVERHRKERAEQHEQAERWRADVIAGRVA